MAERPLRLAVLSVLGGPLHGRRYELEEVVTEVLVGSDADCHLHVDLPSISPIHARLWTDLNGAVAHDTRAPRGLFVNVRRVEGQAPVKDGDVLWLGPPQEAGSVCIQCHFEPWVEVLPEAPESAAYRPEPAPSAEDRAAAAADESPEPVASGGSDLPPSADADPSLTVAFLADELTPPPGAAEAPIEPPGPRPEADAGTPRDEAPAVFAASDTDTSLDAALSSIGPSPSAEAAQETLFEADEVPSGEAEPQPAWTGEPEPPPWTGEPEQSPHQAAEPQLTGSAETPAPEDPFFVGEDATAPPPREPAADEPTPVATSEDWIIGESAPSPPAATEEELFAPSPPAPTTAGGPSSVAATEKATEEEDFFIAEEAVVVAPETGPAGSVPSAPAPSFPEPSFPEPVFPEPPAPNPLPAPPAAAQAQPPSPTAADIVERAPGPPRQPPAPELEDPEDASAARAAEEATARAAGIPRGASAPATPVARRAPRGPAPTPARRAAAAPRRAARRQRSGLPPWLRAAGIVVVMLGAMAAGAFGVIRWLGAAVRLDEVSPARLRVGQRATLIGSGFSADPAENSVVFGDRPAKVLQASATRLEVEVPEAVAEAGAERRVPVVVKRGSREAPPIEVSVFQGPRLHGLSPDVAMPGEEVLLAGAGWGLGATVRFGDVPGKVVEADATQIRAIVPPLSGGSGTSAPVVVTVGGIESNPAPFFVGRVPLVAGVEPPTAAAGDMMSVSGRGFHRDPLANDVRIGGRAALVVGAFADELQVVVPRVSADEAAPALEVRVPGSSEVGRTVLPVQPSPDPLGFEFVAEPFPGPPERPHAVLTTGLGPAFVLAASGGRSAAARALEAQRRLNASAQVLAASPGLVPEARELATSPVIGLAGRPDVLLDVTVEDAAAYEEDWTRLRGRGGPVTPARLARWWEAVARDLALMLVRNERPRFAAALAPEGKALQEVFDAARVAGGTGIRRDVVAGGRASVRDGLRLVALRVPASVTAVVPAASGVGPAAATPTPRRAALRLEGTWSGSEEEGGQRRYLTVRFRRGSGSVAYESGISFTLPMLALEEPGRDLVRFTVEFRGGLRHYHGRWDGQTLSGEISRDEAGRTVVGRFELRPR